MSAAATTQLTVALCNRFFFSFVLLSLLFCASLTLPCAANKRKRNRTTKWKLRCTTETAICQYRKISPRQINDDEVNKKNEPTTRIMKHRENREYSEKLYAVLVGLIVRCVSVAKRQAAAANGAIERKKVYSTQSPQVSVRTKYFSCEHEFFGLSTISNSDRCAGVRVCIRVREPHASICLQTCVCCLRECVCVCVQMIRCIFHGITLECRERKKRTQTHTHMQCQEKRWDRRTVQSTCTKIHTIIPVRAWLRWEWVLRCVNVSFVCMRVITITTRASISPTTTTRRDKTYAAQQPPNKRERMWHKSKSSTCVCVCRSGATTRKQQSSSHKEWGIFPNVVRSVVMWSVVAVIIVIVVVARSHIHALVIEVCACLSVGRLYSICRITFYLSFTFLRLCLSSSQRVRLPLASSPSVYPFLRWAFTLWLCTVYQNMPRMFVTQPNKTRTQQSGWFFNYWPRVCIESDFLEWKSIAFCVRAWLYRAIHSKCIRLSISKGSNGSQN